MGGGASADAKGISQSDTDFYSKYTLSRELGSGAFSVVKLAINKETNQEFAVKVINKSNLQEDDAAALIVEIKILKDLDHPNIIKLTEVFEDTVNYFVVLELVSGGELFDRIVKKSCYTEKEARDFVRSFLETIKYLHDKHVVHRDLKPENLLLTSELDDANMKVADFGFAKKVEDLKPNEVACGTPGYVAPEILRGDPYGVEVDIWSAGVICYVLLAGYPPFYDDNQKKLFKKIKDGAYYFHEDYWYHVSQEAMDLIRKMLCVNQTERWTAAQLLNHPWLKMDDALLEGKDITKSLDEMKKFLARRRFKAAGTAVKGINKLMMASKSMGMKKTSDIKGTGDDVADLNHTSEVSTSNLPPSATDEVLLEDEDLISMKLT